MKALTITVAALLTVVVAAAAQQQPRRNTGLIVGHVVDGNSGAPVADAIVTLVVMNPQGAFPVATDIDGGFVFTGLQRSTYMLSVSKPGYATGAFGQRRPGGEWRQFELADGQRLADVKLLVWKHGSISGAVFDEAGEPVVGVMVRALRWGTFAGRRRLLSEGHALTDDRGIYRIATLPPGEYTTLLPGTQATVPANVYERYWNDPSNSELRSAVTAALPITPPGAPQTRQFGDAVLISAAQSAVPPEPGSGGVLFVVPLTFYPGATTPSLAGTVTLGPGEYKTGADIRAAPVPTTRVSGTVIGPSGPMGLCPVRLLPRWGEDFAGETGLEAATTMTDAAGNFLFIGVTPGTYVARASANLAMSFPDGMPRCFATPRTTVPSMWAAEPVMVGNQEASVRLTLRSALTVAGRFEFDGTAPRPTPERLRQIPVVIEPIDANPESSGLSSRRSNADGTFSASVGRAGRYFIRTLGPPERWVLKSVTHEGRDITETALEVTEDLTQVVMTFTDRPTEVNGRVRGADGAPDDSATVLIFPADSAAWVDFGLNPGRLRSRRVETSATYTLRVLPGDYYIVAIPEELVTGWRDPKVLEPLTRRATRVRLFSGDAKVVDLTTVR